MSTCGLPVGACTIFSPHVDPGKCQTNFLLYLFSRFWTSGTYFTYMRSACATYGSHVNIGKCQKFFFGFFTLQIFNFGTYLSHIWTTSAACGPHVDIGKCQAFQFLQSSFQTLSFSICFCHVHPINVTNAKKMIMEVEKNSIFIFFLILVYKTQFSAKHTQNTSYLTK